MADKMIKRCKICGSEFRAKGRQIYCSGRCSPHERGLFHAKPTVTDRTAMQVRLLGLTTGQNKPTIPPSITNPEAT